MMAKRIVVHSGQKFGYLTVISEIEHKILSNGRKVRQVRVKCRCGTVKDMILTNVSRGTTKSCGCYNSQLITERNVKHGLCEEPVYWLHASMLQRCRELTGKNAERYAARGIKVCDEWLDVAVFAKWANENGYKKGLQIEREDNNKGYDPSNCSFVTPEINAQNRSTSFVWHIKGKVFPSCRAAGDYFGVNAQTIWNWAERDKHPDCWKVLRYAKSA